MYFELGSDTLQLQCSAQYPLTQQYELIQVKERSATGITQTENYEVELNRFTYNFKNMSQNDYQQLLNWFVSIAKGFTNEFYLTDDLGVTRLVRFVDSKLSFNLTSYQLWDGNFTVEETS